MCTTSIKPTQSYQSFLVKYFQILSKCDAFVLIVLHWIIINALQYNNFLFKIPNSDNFFPVYVNYICNVFILSRRLGYTQRVSKINFKRPQRD